MLEEISVKTHAEMLEERLRTMALVARADAHPQQWDDMREMTRIIINILGTVLTEMRQRTLGTAIMTPETVRLTAEESVEIAKQAIRSARMFVGYAHGAQVAEQYQEDAAAELQAAIEGVAEFQAECMEQAEQEALAEAARLGQEAARTACIEEIVAPIRRLN
jgi:hypothetical protein